MEHEVHASADAHLGGVSQAFKLSGGSVGNRDRSGQSALVEAKPDSAGVSGSAGLDSIACRELGHDDWRPLGTDESAGRFAPTQFVFLSFEQRAESVFDDV